MIRSIRARHGRVSRSGFFPRLVVMLGPSLCMSCGMDEVAAVVRAIAMFVI